MLRPVTEADLDGLGDLLPADLEMNPATPHAVRGWPTGRPRHRRSARNTGSGSVDGLLTHGRWTSWCTTATR